MNNSSENREQQKHDEHFFKISPQIARQLEHFVSEKHYLFDYYRRNKHIKKPSPIDFIWNSIVDYYWKKKISRKITYLILFLMSLGLASNLLTNQIDKSLINTIGGICWILLFIQLMIFLFSGFKNPFKNRHNLAKCIDLASQFDPRNHSTIINNIGENNSVQDIKIEKQRFQIIIIAQTRANDVGDSLIPLISFFYALFILFMFGTPENWGESLNIATIFGYGIIPLITTFFSFFAKLSSENLVIYQHCLFILQEALMVAQEKEQKCHTSDENQDSKLIHEALTISENTNDVNCLKKFIDERK